MRRTALVLSLSLLFLYAACKSPKSVNYEPRAVPSGSAAVRGALLSYADVVDQVAPAVVTIRSSQRVRAPRQFPFFDDPIFREFFGGQIPRDNSTQVRESLGSGVIIREDGHIVTNHHVIDGADQIKVDLPNRQTYSARVVGSDPRSDLAVLKISGGGLPVLHMANSDGVRVGDVCLAVGNPLGVGETVTAGIISAKGRSTGLSNGSFEDFLQTDAPINRGNSGGALVNTRGELIGINSQIVSPSQNGGNIGIGFAIPSNMVKTVVEQLVAKGSVRRGAMGVVIQNVTSDLAQGLGLKEARGIVISSVNPGGAAEKAGLKNGDVILKLNGKDVRDTNEFRNQIAASAPGTEVTVSIQRNGAPMDVRVKLDELAAEGDPTASRREQPGDGNNGGRLGLTVEPMSPDYAEQLGVRRNTPGLVVTQVDRGGAAAAAGIRPGDIIQEVNRQPVRSTSDVMQQLQKSGNRPPLLLVSRGGNSLYVAVPLR